MDPCVTARNLPRKSLESTFTGNRRILDAVRINLNINSDDAQEGDEILFYVDNLIIDNFSA